MDNPLQIFIAYARKDTTFLDELRVQLKPLERSGKVHIWYDGKIEPGQVWEAAIKKNLHSADIILMLVSADAIASDYFYDKEMADALERHHKGEARVVPFIIRPCAWQATPLADLQALPKNGKAVTRWDDRDHAYSDAVNTLWAMIENLNADKQAERKKVQQEEKEQKEKEQQRKEAALAAQQKHQRQQQEQVAKEQQQKEAALTAQKEQGRQQKLKEQQTQKANERRQLQAAEKERRRLAEAERKHQQETKKKQRQEKFAAGLLALILLLISIKMCNQPNGNLPIGENAIDSTEIAQGNDGPVSDMAPPPDLTKEIEKQKEPKSDPCKNHGGDADKDGLCADEDCNDSNPKASASKDSDGDGLCNDIDKCDYEKGPASNNGCPVKQPESPSQKTKSGFDFVKVKGGTYTMGSPRNEKDRDDDECQHSVTVSSFEIGKYEVTQADWRKVMGEDPPELKFKGCDQCPVERVSWDDIQIFIKKANAKYGQKFRLPTEEEWEYAARGGSKSKGYLYAGSDSIKEVAWFRENSSSKTHSVGGKKANELGIYDMSGNVWEWCADTWGPYPNCKGEKKTSIRVVRGGSWYDNNRDCRVANRVRFISDNRYFEVGFRLVRY